MAYPYSKNQRMVSKGPDVPKTPGLEPVKTDGRIGSATPPSYLKGGFGATDRNPKGNAYWAKRQAASRAAAARDRRAHASPVNSRRPGLHKAKPD